MRILQSSTNPRSLIGRKGSPVQKALSEEDLMKKMLREDTDDRIQFPDEVEPCLSKIPNSGIGVRCKTAINDG